MTNTVFLISHRNAFRNLLLAFAQFEREMIIERTQEGKVIARQRAGYREGRPKKSYNQVAAETGISKSSLVREKKRR